MLPQVNRPETARERFAGGMSCGALNTTSIAAFFFTWINTDNLAVWLGPCIDFLTEKGVPFQRPLNQDRWWRPSLPQGPFLPHRSHHLGPTDIATCIQITLTSQGQSNFSFLSIFQYWTNATHFSAELSGEANEKKSKKLHNWADRPFVLYIMANQLEDSIRAWPQRLNGQQKQIKGSKETPHDISF
jgi:hypothetical protein